MLVGAVLGPQQAEHRQLDVVRLATELLDDQLELGVGEAELAVPGGGDGQGAEYRACARRLSVRPDRRCFGRSARVVIPRMGSSTVIRSAAPTLIALAALALPVGAAAGTSEDPPKAELATTGNDSELLESVPIATAAGLDDRVAMSLGPDELEPNPGR